MELVRRGQRNRKALIKILASETHPAARIQALGALQTMVDAEVQTAFEKALRDGDAELQRLAAEALGLCAKKADRSAQNALLLALASEDYAVRRAVALAMGRLAGPGAGDNLAAALSFDKSKDPFLHDGIVRGLEMLGKPGMDSLLALADSGVQKDTDRVVEVFLGLRSRSAFEALATLLKHRHVSSSQRAELIRSAANYLLDPPVALDGLVALVAGEEEPEEVRKALLDVLGTQGTVKGAKATQWVLSQLKDSEDPMRRHALRTLRVVDSVAAAARARGYLTGNDAGLQREAVLVLSATGEGARLVGKTFLQKKLPAALREEVLAALRKHSSKDADAARLLTEILKASGEPGGK
jgi:hypothetical protein